MPKRRAAPEGCTWRGNVLYGRKTVNGKDRRWSLHTNDPEVAKRERAKSEERLGEIKRGDVRLTVAEFMKNEWMPWLAKNVGPRTERRYVVSINVMGPWIGKKFLDEIDGKLVSQIVSDRGKLNVSNATIKRDLVALSSFMKYAVARGFAKANPAKPLMELIKERRDPIVLPQEPSIKAIIARAPGMFSKLIEAARITGAREEELASMRWWQVDLKARRLTIIGKGNKLRVLDLSKPRGAGYRFFRELPAGIADDAYVFWHGTNERYENVASRFAFLCSDLAKKAPAFKRFRFHDLRHLAAVEYLRAGGDIYDLQKRLGHSSIKTTELYLKYLTPEEERAAKGGTKREQENDATVPGVPESVPGDAVVSRNVPYGPDSIH